MICLTFDTDYMSEDSLCQFVGHELALVPGSSTVFAHKFFDCLASAENVEIGPHPTLSDLDNWDEHLTHLEQQYQRQFVGFRSHSCVYSHLLGINLAKRGYQYISQADVPRGMEIGPYRHPWGNWELPIYYMDSMELWRTENNPGSTSGPFDPTVFERAISGNGLYVFDFHPIHIALNTSSVSDYQSKKEAVIQGVNPYTIRGDAFGVGDFFADACVRMKASGTASSTCSSALRTFEELRKWRD